MVRLPAFPVAAGAVILAEIFGRDRALGDLASWEFREWPLTVYLYAGHNKLN